MSSHQRHLDRNRLAQAQYQQRQLQAAESREREKAAAQHWQSALFTAALLGRHSLIPPQSPEEAEQLKQALGFADHLAQRGLLPPPLVAMAKFIRQAVKTVVTVPAVETLPDHPPSGETPENVVVHGN